MIRKRYEMPKVLSGQMEKDRKICEEKYADLLYLDRPQPKTQPAMSLYDRAVQFSPFAALSGYGMAIQKAEETFVTENEDGLEHTPWYEDGEWD